MTHREALTLLHAAGNTPLPGPRYGSWWLDVDGEEIKTGTHADGGDWWAIWGATRAHGTCLISALKMLASQIAVQRRTPGAAEAARRISGLVARMEAVR